MKAIPKIEKLNLEREKILRSRHYMRGSAMARTIVAVWRVIVVSFRVVVVRPQYFFSFC